MKLSAQIPQIFASMRKLFCSIAIKYKVPNPGDFADEWQSQAFFIANRFDTGELTKKALDSSIGVLSESPDEIEFLKSFRAYLVKSFENDCLKAKQSGKRTKSLDSFSKSGDEFDSTVELPTIFNKDVVEDFKAETTKSSKDITNAQISHLIKIIKKDVMRSSDAENITEAINNIFYQAYYDCCLDIKQEREENFVIAFDITSEGARVEKEFVDDLRSRIRPKLLTALIKEECPLTCARLYKILFSETNDPVNERIRTYFLEYKGGMPARLKVLLK